MMKRIAFFLGGLLTLPVFAEVAPIYFEDDIVYSDTEYDDADLVDEVVDESANVKNMPKVVSKPVGSRSISTSRVTASRTVPSGAAATTSGRGSGGAAARVVAARATSSNVSPRSTASRSVTNRAATTRAATTGSGTQNITRAATSAAATRATGGASNTATRARSASGRGTTAATRARSGLIQTNTVSQSLYNPNGARVGVRGNVGTTYRVPAIRSGSTTYTAESGVSAASTSELDELAELTDYCKAQYANCMDNYCNVLDDNQGRCSCSANLKNYAKSEATLKQVTEELQEVAQKIRYIGLNSRDVETLFTQTEAELKMQSTNDNSQMKNDLDKIRNMIVDVQSGSATTSASSDLSFDLSGLLDFNIDSTGFDLTSFLGGFNTSNTSSIKNQRGEQLYKTAAARCKSSVLNSCVAQGVDAAIITNSYDLEIDKQCIAYERSLNDSNEQMAATVRNAKFVLQNARLLVANQKNEYSDMRQCVTALDACMQDDFVCGSDYEKCLDPTGRYIVNGELVVGSQPGQAIDPNTSLDSAADSNVCKVNLYRTWDFGSSSCSGNYAQGQNQGNAWGTGSDDTLAKYIDATVTTTAAQGGSVNMSQYLQNKIGYVDNSTGINYGMCVSVLNKCQNYTYTGAGTNTKYNPTNDVIKQYLARVLVQIKSKQDEILNDYAQNCITDVTSCLNQNNYPISTAANNVQQRVAINACRNTVITCMSVTGYSTENPTPAQMANWVYGILGQLQSTDSETSATIPGYVQSQKTITYQCDSVGAESHNVSPVLVSTNGKWKHKDACSEKTGYTCEYCKPGTTCQPGTNTTNQLVNPTNYEEERDYSLEYSSVIKFVCNENMMETPVTYNCGGNATSAGLSEQVGVITQLVNIRDGCTPDQNYTCSYEYDNQPVSVNSSVDYVTGVNQIVADCTQTGITLTYNCNGNGTDSDVDWSLSQQYSVNQNACTTPEGHTCTYTYGEGDVTNGNAFDLNAATTQISFNCTPSTYSVTFDCGNFADPISGVDATQDVTYGTLNSLTDACTAKNGYTCSGYTVNDTEDSFYINSGTYTYTGNITITPFCSARTANLNYFCSTGTSGTGGTTTVTYNQPINAAANCSVNTGYNANTCYYASNMNNVATNYGTVGQNYQGSFGTFNNVYYACNPVVSNVSFSCGDLPSYGSTQTNQQFTYGQNVNNFLVSTFCNDSNYNCSGWKVYGTGEVPDMNSWNITDSDVTLVPNCTTGE